jgi:conjugal transfer/type IV secretion protein DotA/TraY
MRRSWSGLLILLLVCAALPAQAQTAIALDPGNDWAATIIKNVFPATTGNTAIDHPIFYGCMALLIPGLLLAFALPMVPFAMWIAGVARWLVLVFETIVAVPLWAFALLTFQGDGLHGRGIDGYSLPLNVLVRPSLMLISLFLGYYMFTRFSW